MHAEDTFLAHVEFDRPDFPWIFTPAAPSDGGSWLPWVALVVLRAARAELKPARRQTPGARADDQVRTPAAGRLVGLGACPGRRARPSTTRVRRGPPHPAVRRRNLSRLLCPRRLQPDQDYLACVVPAYDAGVKTGLADTSSPPTLDPAWRRQLDGSDGDDEIVLPVYTSWTFSTASDGDFRSLAELLVPRLRPGTSAGASSTPPARKADSGRSLPVSPVPCRPYSRRSCRRWSPTRPVPTRPSKPLWPLRPRYGPRSEQRNCAGCSTHPT